MSQTAGIFLTSRNGDNFSGFMVAYWWEGEYKVYPFEDASMSTLKDLAALNGVPWKLTHTYTDKPKLTLNERYERIYFPPHDID